jgi:predicted RNA binding protein YcfA (HicA-like mRNA interferase family)
MPRYERFWPDSEFRRREVLGESMSKDRREKASEVDILWGELPSVFDIKKLPANWDDEWIIVPIDSPESPTVEPNSPEEVIFGETLAALEVDNVQNNSRSRLPQPLSGSFPGALQGISDSPYAPPDAFAFYLPFHLFYPEWWGIYLLAEGVRDLARILRSNGGGDLPDADCQTAARIFLFGHEQYHHSVESFATRLEITHRGPIYTKGFDEFYQRSRGTTEWLEEALANAYAYQRVMKAYVKEPAKKRLLAKAFDRYVKESPPGYDQGMKYAKAHAFIEAQAELAETGHHESALSTPKANRELWSAFSHGFHPFRKRGSHVVYLVHRDSSIARRSSLAGRYLRYREVVRRLENLGCLIVREGKGSHEIWRGPNQRTFPVPRHRGDLKMGTLAGILKQAGIQMRLEEFLQLHS